MHAQGFLDQKTRFPLGMAAAIVIHAAALSALWFAKNDYIPDIKTILTVRHIPLAQPEPEPTPLPAAKDVIPNRPQTPIDARTPVIPLSADSANVRPMPPAQPLSSFGDGIGTVIEIEPLRLPVLTEAAVDQRYAGDFQPPYPAGKQRLGEEGLVVVRVLIGTDGRVKRVESVNGADDAFLAATERQALRRWRFKPATRDGAAIESWRTMTVRFEIRG